MTRKKRSVISSKRIDNPKQKERPPFCSTRYTIPAQKEEVEGAKICQDKINLGEEERKCSVVLGKKCHKEK